MNFDADARTIFLTRHGSHCYGLNVATSDLDIKGICVKPKASYFGFLNGFEQVERMAAKGHENDTVIYSVDKFTKLASDNNPNIIEILFVDDSDVLKIDEFGEELRSIRNDFLSRKARYTFAGYAHAQLKRIKTHRSWLLNPPKQMPTRADFGLPLMEKVSKSELGAFNALVNDGKAVELPKDVLTLFNLENQYQNAETNWKHYQNWVKERNAKRAELEAKFGFDTKHGMHLIRLMRMCKEILSTGKVLVRRPDRDELLAIRNGLWSYDRVIDHAEDIEAQCGELYDSSPLPREPNREKLNEFLVNLTDRYLAKHG
jgi:predicted nucleotidyltransferase